MVNPVFSIAVYCGSRPGTEPAHTAAASEVGTWIGSRGGQLVYGGGKTGLMGSVARACAQAGGRVLGVMPQALVAREVANTDCDELVVVETMHQRKAIMAERSDAFVAMAGGIGTFEELFEIWTWRQLGYHNKPVGLLNINGYYDGLNTFIQTALKAEFMDDRQMALIEVGCQPAALLHTLVGHLEHNLKGR